MEDPRTADGIEHLQAAARELLLAARSFLNVVEEVVDDRDRFAGAASGVVDLLRDGLGVVAAGPSTSPLQPWERAAWAGGDAPPPQQPDEPHEPHPAASEPDEAESGAVAAPSVPTGAAPRRVRRIAVD